MTTIEQSKEKLAKQYDVFAHKFHEIYVSGKERGRDAMDLALEKTRDQLTALGEFSKQQGEDFKEYLARDLDQTQADIAALGEEAKEMLKPSRLGVGARASLISLLDSTSGFLNTLSKKASASPAYHTGEITAAGTLTCKKCAQTLNLKATGHIPPCPKCHATEFSKRC